jgi:hypothetical protein
MPEPDNHADNSPHNTSDAAARGAACAPLQRHPDAAQPAALPPAAQRALAEADARRRAAVSAGALPAELGGRDGPDPARYGDWERKGLAIDF